MGKYFFAISKELAGMPDAAECSELKSHCSKRESRLLRLTCPSTCGCADNSSFWFRGAMSGCLKQCVAVAAQPSRISQCVDMRNPEKSTGWLAFWDSYLEEKLELNYEIGAVSETVKMY